jgi:ribosome biogenesis GTPase
MTLPPFFQQQLIAANVDTLLIVSGLNDDFNLNRLERYLALANEAGAHPVLVLTRADQCANGDIYLRKAAGLGGMLDVVAVNALDADSCRRLDPWLGAGQTLAMLGSSGAGKSTLLNTLLGEALQQTGGIREKDSKGRHTTTARSLHRLPGGAPGHPVWQTG